MGTKLSPGRFREISFSDAKFLGEASFSSRNFTRTVDLSGALFAQPPDFTGTEGWDNLDLTGTRFEFPGWTKKSEVATRLRRMRKIAADIHAQDVERDLFIAEREAERGVLWTKKQWYRAANHTILLFFYWLLSNCGRSAMRPFVGLAIGNSGFGLLYHGMAQAGKLDHLVTFTLAHLVPFFGISRRAYDEARQCLFGADVLPVGVQMTVVAQGLLNAILLFLLLLALRNHFRVG